MNKENNKEGQGDALRVIISGGGTGGHIFPAVSIANAIKELRPDAQILFVGAEGRMEMQRVPDAGYQIIGLPVAGFDRKHLWKNVAVLLKLVRSQWKARNIIRQFRPQVAVGVGGYASGPTLKMAGMMGVPTLIQEQNSYAGVTNKLLAQKARRICVAYDGMEKFFPANKIIMTGNPVRQNLLAEKPEREQAIRSFGLNPEKKTILILGGSLGARTINNTLIGAGSISEFCLLNKPVILVPSPNVAEDHQTKNALALVNKQAAIYVKDAEAENKLLPVALETIANAEKLSELSENIAHLALPDSAVVIAKEVIKLAQQS